MRATTVPDGSGEATPEGATSPHWRTRQTLAGSACPDLT